MPRTVIPPRSHRRVPARTAAVRDPLPLMMKAGLAAGIALAALCLALPVRAEGPPAELEAGLAKVDAGLMHQLATDPGIIAAIRAQNTANAGLTEADILARDKVWRAEVGTASTPTISAVAANPASAILHKAKEGSEGLITEAFVMDNRGLNVGMSDTTSDYWQGDEPKWQETFLKGPGARHVSDVDFDDSSQTYIIQLSEPVIDPDSGKPIGALTLGLDAEALGNL